MKPRLFPAMLALATMASPALAFELATTEAVLAKVPRETVFDGAIEAVNQSTVAAQTSGRVLELPFDVGDYVEHGTVIARLTSTEQAAQVEAAESARAEADARLAEATLVFERTRDVYNKQLIAKSQFDRAQAEYKAARARAEAAEAALTRAREALDYTVIRAPYSGTVVNRHVQQGETVGPGQPIMTGLSLEHLRARVAIPQQHMGAVRIHGQARVMLPDGTSLPIEDLRLPPGANASTHSFEVLVNLPEGQHDVFPGTLIKVAFVSGEDTRLLVPAEAVVRRGEVTGVYVVDGDRISLRYVRLGTPTADGRVPVLAGLSEGDRIALDPIAAASAYKAQAQPDTGQAP
ncbi:efflux RND transporter periplasmic adaptor subunit [uncultured Abyssibacter sp.]|uniref:efflux RND transporter periplasmic adaptor subunit n=1 Tax=uncultured Abyssibacter sp. TaxID=2320202 RepID=UPI0032B1292E